MDNHEHWWAIGGYAVLRAMESGGRWLLTLFVTAREQARIDFTTVLREVRAMAEAADSRARAAEAKVALLEAEVQVLKDERGQCAEENAALKTEVEKLKGENRELRDRVAGLEAARG